MIAGEELAAESQFEGDEQQSGGAGGQRAGAGHGAGSQERGAGEPQPGSDVAQRDQSGPGLPTQGYNYSQLQPTNQPPPL